MSGSPKAEDAQVLVFGHTHKPWIHTYGGVLFVNCGSVGKPKDGDPRAAFAILELDEHGQFQVSIERVPYDAEAVAREVEAAGLPGEYAEKLVAAAYKEREKMKYVLFVCTHNAGRSQMAQALFERYAPEDVRGESAGSDPARQVWPEVIEVMREVEIDLSRRKPKRLSVEMQLHADWAVTMGCGEVCPYVPTTVDDWDIPDPAGLPLDEVSEIRDLIDERVHELAGEKIDAIRFDETSHRWRLAEAATPADRGVR